MTNILPKPRKMTCSKETKLANGQPKVKLDGTISGLESVLKTYFRYEKSVADADLCFERDENIPKENYILLSEDGKTVIRYYDYPGACHGLSTFIQLVSDGRIPLFVEIEDGPGLHVRGYLLDISRDKIPTMETIHHIVDMLFLLKMNHFELYVEGFPVYFPSFPDVPYQDPIMPEDMAKIEEYCLDRGIEFTRNVNTLGHMTKWLALPEYHHLAECEDGYINQGYPFPASTLNPLDPDSFALVRQLIEDAIGDSKAETFNVNGDEPFELSEGKSREDCLEKGRGKVYLDYMDNVFREVSLHHKRPIVWGDVFNDNPDLYERIPDDVIVCDWGYDSEHDFMTPAARMEKAGATFLLAPGTSSWNSFAGRLEDMTDTVKNSVEAAKIHHGEGIILTDWGDYSHPQMLMVSYPGIVKAASASWSDMASDRETGKWLDAMVFKDGKRGYGEKLIALSGYHLLEDFSVSNGTLAGMSWMFIDPDPRHPLSFKANIWKEALSHYPISPDNAKRIFALCMSTREGMDREGSLWDREIIQTADLVEMAALMNLIANKNSTDYSKAIQLIADITDSYRDIWLARNREAGLSLSLERLSVLSAFLHNRELL